MDKATTVFLKYAAAKLTTKQYYVAAARVRKFMNKDPKKRMDKSLNSISKLLEKASK